jgi:hypothetical protein
MRFIKIMTGVLLLFTNVNVYAQFKNLPASASPELVGKRVAERFLITPHGEYGYDAAAHIPYFEVCVWYGGLGFAAVTGNDILKTKLIERFQPLFSNESALLPVPDHVDYTVFGFGKKLCRHTMGTTGWAAGGACIISLLQPGVYLANKIMDR